jgi:hypothetical protein
VETDEQERRVIRAKYVLFATAVLGIGAVAWLGISHAGANSTPPANGLPSPTVLPATTLTAPLDYPDSGISLEPPGSQTASFSAADAIAWSSDHEGLPAVSVQPILALLPAGGSIQKDMLVWELRYSGACIPAFGPVGGSGQEDQCGQEWDVLVDANTGTFIDAFSVEPLPATPIPLDTP